jgi:thiosulfate reductase cytochrome b subunit
VGGIGTCRRREVVGKVGRRVNTVQKCVYMYIIAIMIPVETIPGIEERVG